MFSAMQSFAYNFSIALNVNFRLNAAEIVVVVNESTGDSILLLYCILIIKLYRNIIVVDMKEYIR